MSSDPLSHLKNICIFGVGGVGGFFGGKIANRIAQDKDDSTNVYFIARGEHLEAIRSKGLVLNTDKQKPLVCRPTLATEDVSKLPMLDLCLICVKSYDLENAVSALKPKTSENTIIIPLLNGVDIYDRIQSQLSEGMVLPACVYVGTHIEKPGTVTQIGGSGIILCGENPRIPDWDPQALLGFFDRVEIAYKWSKDPFPAIWEKYIFIAAYALVTGCLNKPIGAVFADDTARDSVRKIMLEIVAIAQKKGVKLPSDVIENAIQMAKNFQFETKTSYQRDLEQTGKRNEGDLFGGTIMRLGEKYNIPTPETISVYSQIKGRLESNK